MDAVGGDGTVGRYGGERFVLILPGVRQQAAEALTEQVVAQLARVDRGHLASFGVAQWVRGTGAERLMGDADHALSAALRGQARAVS